jgi:hypothetical protein
VQGTIEMQGVTTKIRATLQDNRLKFGNDQIQTELTIEGNHMRGTRQRAGTPRRCSSSRRGSNGRTKSGSWHRMLENILYLVSSFWLGAVHAATPGHGKTIAAPYIVGARGRPVDALVLGIFVTLSHTSGIILVAVLATLGSAWLIPRRVEAYLAIGTGVLVIAIRSGGTWGRRQRGQMSTGAGTARGS